jgi:uncharacterized protein YkwD
VSVLALQAVDVAAAGKDRFVIGYDDGEGHSETVWVPAPKAVGVMLSAPDASQFEQEVLELTNQVRREAGLAPLRFNESLREAALGHAQDMAVNDFVDHIGSDGSTLRERINRTDYRGWLLATENVAAGFMSPQAVVNAWMGSTEHRNNLLSPALREIGMAYVYDANDAYGGLQHYWVQVFSARRKVYPVIINDEAALTPTSQVDLYLHGTGWAAEMLVSDYPDFRDATWRPFQSEMSWSLPHGTGDRTVYVQLRKADGQTSDTLDTIILQESGSWPEPATEPDTPGTASGEDTEPAPM